MLGLKRSLSIRLFAGVVVSLAALAVYAGYTTSQLRVLRRLQTEIIDRNRQDSVLLVRIQNDLNMLGLAMRDVLDARDGYPLTAWRAQFARIRTDLEDALKREGSVAPAGRTPEQTAYLTSSVAQFWDALDRMFELAATNEAEARVQVRLSLQARQEALSTTVARFLVQNSESDEQAVAGTQRIHTEVERNLYVFLALMLLGLAGVSAHLIIYNHRVFDQVTALSQRRSELAQQLITMQESTFRSLSRELHDEFGQILTAVGAMLQRSSRLATSNPAAFREQLREVHEVVQSTLEKVRSLSQALHPVMLEEVGFESALDTYVATFEKRTGIVVRLTKAGVSRSIGREPSIHLYRVLQEALNNVARHSGASAAEVRLTFAAEDVTLEIEDAGGGIPDARRDGLGLVSMRERADIVGGHIEFLKGQGGRGTLVRFKLPLVEEESRVAAEA